MNELLLKKLRNEINCELKLNLSHCGIFLSRQMMGYQLGLFKKSSKVQQGKRFRPILCLLSSLAMSGDYKKALPAAAAIELIHNFSLIHDDIQDEDKYRRGKSTVWKKWGRNQAINAGDAMHTLANLALLRLFKTNLDLKVINSVLSVVNYACYQMCEGQMLDIDFERRADVGISEYLKMIQKKTAALIESATFTGALIATRNQRIIERYRNFGLNVGMAFQVFNDISGFGDNSREKFVHFQSDLKKNKKTLPSILALEKLGSGRGRGTGAIKKSREIGEKYLEKAILELNETGIKNPVQELLKEYVQKIRII